MLSNTVRLFIAAVLVLGFAKTAQAGAYATLGLSVEDIQPETDFDSFTATGLNARLGYDFGRYFGLEAEGQLGLSGEGDNPRFQEGALVQNETYNYNSGFVLFLRPQLPVSENLSLSFRAGVGEQYFDRTVDNPDLPNTNRARVIEDKSSIGYAALGTGIEYKIGKTKTDSVRLDYTRRFRFEDFGDEGLESFSDNRVTLSYVRKF